MKTHFLRLGLMLGFLLFLLIILIIRIYDLTILRRGFLQKEGNARSVRTIQMKAYRGMIVDKEGAPLAISTPIETVWLNPKIFDFEHENVSLLLKYLKLNKSTLISRLENSKNKEFIYLKRHIPPYIANKIRDLNIPGINFKQEFKRFYSDGETVAQLIGFTDIDDKGIEGLEFAYNDWLRGQDGKKRVIIDRQGLVVEELDVLQEPAAGKDLALSIDRRIQFFAYNALKETVLKFNAKAGSLVVLDTKTGEILAVANAPSFNPNIREKYNKENYRNVAFVDIFEPGSVVKPLSLASAIETGKFNAKSIIDTRPSWLSLQGNLVRDLHDYGVLDVNGVLLHSSNVGVSKMVLASPPEQLLNLLEATGIGQKTEINYPGEGEGSLTKLNLNSFVLATLGFGYGMTVTTLQLARSYLIFANKGCIFPISILQKNSPGKCNRVISKNTAQELLLMMENAVLSKEGTSNLAKIASWRVAGKTGTAKIAGKKGYTEKKYISSFVGIAPVSNPRLIIAVVIFEPSSGGYYARTVAAPLFAKVMEASLRILDIPTDNNVKE